MHYLDSSRLLWMTKQQPVRLYWNSSPSEILFLIGAGRISTISNSPTTTQFAQSLAPIQATGLRTLKSKLCAWASNRFVTNERFPPKCLQFAVSTEAHSMNEMPFRTSPAFAPKPCRDNSFGLGYPTASTGRPSSAAKDHGAAHDTAAL